MIEKKILITRSVGGHLHAVHFLSRGENSSEKDEIFPFVILCHGLTGDKYEWGRFTKTAKALNEEGFDALIFDFSGSGENERESITLSKQVKDLEDIYTWAKNKGYTRIAVIGLSFGGLTALVAELPGIKTYVFWAPGFYAKEEISKMAALQKTLEKGALKLPSSGDYKHIMIDNSFLEALAKYEVNSYLQKLLIPTLIIQGTRDMVVKCNSTREAFNQLPQDDSHKLVEIEKATHNFDGVYLTKFIDSSIHWLKKYL